ncbi:MAG: DegT/DnrJ/EryC1/StrS family aminotransferase [Planctomycetota bacterium]
MKSKPPSPKTSAAAAWKVPRSKAHLFNRQINKQILEAIEPALFGDYWDFPDLLLEFEERFSEYIGLEYVAAVQSGTAALILALKAAGVQYGDEIITVANSDMSTTSAIVNCGAKPVFCDVLASDYTMNPDLVEPLISERTRCLLPVDLYGHPANVKQLQHIARQNNLLIVEDAALATASRDFGLPMGAFADLVCFSTTSTKQIGGIGSGGMVATADCSLRDTLEMYRNYGLSPGTKQIPHSGNDQQVDGLNVKMSPVNAAVVRTKLEYLPAWTERRKQIAGHYESRLQNRDGITLASFRPESDPVRREFALCVRNRNQVFDTLREKGVQAALNYSPPAHQRTVYRDLDLLGSKALTVTESVAQETLSLPIDPMLSDDDIDYVCDHLMKAV